VTDFLFDDESWVVRYIVVQTGEWLSNRTVLISTIAIGQPTWSYRTLRVPMTTDQVRNSSEYPGASRPPPGNVGTGVERHTAAEDRARLEHEIDPHRNGDPHLRSTNAMMHYHIKASDGSIGHVQGLLLEEDTWSIRYLIVDTSNWWLGHKVLIAPQWFRGVSWSERAVSIDLTREAIKGSPPYNSEGTLRRDEEVRLYNHYQRAGYWADHVRLENPQFHIAESEPSDGVSRHS
jgi:hypothetical protein